MTFQHDKPATLIGRVIDSAVLSPHNSILSNDRDVYTIVFELENLGEYYELESLFISLDHPHLPTKGDWNISTGVVSASSLLAPRVRNEVKGSEFQVGDRVLCDVRPMCNVLDESLFETLVLISVRKADEEDTFQGELDWTLDTKEYHF